MPENFILSANLSPGLGLVAKKLIYWDTVRACNKAQVVVAPTETALNLLIDHGLKAEHRSITNGLDTDYFKPKAKRSHDGLSILYVGRLYGEKRVDLIIRAMPALLKRLPAATLALVGSGAQSFELQALAVELNVERNVSFLGSVSEAEKLDMLQSADMFVIASPSELQSIASLEALSCGLPIVVANVAALIELVDGGKNGRVFHYPDEKDLADQLYIMLTDSKTRQTYSKNGRAWVLQHHQISKMLELYLGTYQQAIERLK